MASFGLQECHMLEAASNFVLWKCMMQNLVEEVEPWYPMDKEITAPTDPQDLVGHNKKLAKVKQFVLDWVVDHLIHHLAEKKTMKDMYDALVTLY